MKINIVKFEVYTISPFMEALFGVFVGNAVINVDIVARKCTCRGWEMSSMPCEHAYVVAMYLRQNISDFVANVFIQRNKRYTQACFAE